MSLYFSCCVPKCSSVSAGVQMHKLPRNEKRRALWLKQINNHHLNDLTKDQLCNIKVCRKHFESRFHHKHDNRLKSNAYPTLFSESEIANGVPKFDPEISKLKEDAKRHRRVCCAPGCSSRKNLHRFPRYTKRILKWLYLIGDPNLENLTVSQIRDNKRLCQKHFKREYVVNNRLTDRAIPTLFVYGGTYEFEEQVTDISVNHDHTYSADDLSPRRGTVPKYGSYRKNEPTEIKDEPDDDHNYNRKNAETPSPDKCPDFDVKSLSSECYDPDPLALSQCRLCGEVVDSDLRLDSACAPPIDDITYRQLVNQCFSLHMSTLVKSSSVCEECAGRLTEAWQFRSQVADTENKLLAKVTDKELLKSSGEIRSTGVTVLERSEIVFLTISPQIEDEVILSGQHKLDDYDTIGSEVILEDSEEAEVQLPEATSNKPTSGNLKTIKKRRRVRKALPKSGPEASKRINLSLKQIHHKLEQNERIGHLTNASTIIRHSYVLPFSKRHGKFYCVFCKRGFDTSEELREHTNQHDIATAEFLKNIKLAQISVDVTEINCRMCPEKITDLDALVEHLKKEHHKDFCENVSHGVIPFRLRADDTRCVVCDKPFVLYQQLAEHMNEHFAKYKCEKCGKFYLTKQRLMVHHSHVHTISNNLCHICGKTFKNRSLALVHQKMVHERRFNVRCEHCSETFANMVRRVAHLRKVHGIEQEKTTCSICGPEVQFATKYALYRHKSMRHPANPLRCRYCDQQFGEVYKLRQHEAVHMGYKIECDMCNKKFLYSYGLRRHKVMHDVCPFACLFCGQPFRTETRLMAHTRADHPDEAARARGMAVHKNNMMREINTQLKVTKEKQIANVHRVARNVRRKVTREEQELANERRKATIQWLKEERQREAAMQRVNTEKEQRVAVDYLLTYKDME